MALIVVGHPDMAHSLANKAVIEALAQSDIAVEVRALGELYPNYQIDASAEQAALLRHQSIIFQYPVYWYNMPALLKLWFDTVFDYDFAFGPNGSKLQGKYFIPSLTFGGPEADYTALGKHHFRITDFCKSLEQTAYYSEMQYIEPFALFGASPANADYSAAGIAAKADSIASALIAKLKTLEAK